VVVAVAATLVLAAGSAVAQESDIKDGDRYFEQGNYKKAAKKYDRAIKKAPSQVPPGAYGKRAAIFFLEKQYAEGLAFIERALKVHPDAPEILEQQALVLWALNRRQDAISVADVVVATRPDTFSIQALRCEHYFGPDANVASDACERYLKSRPAELEKQDVLPRLRLGFAYLKLDRADDAERELELVAKTFRKDQRALVNANNGLCAVYTASGEYDRAITICERIIENPRNIDKTGSAWYNLGGSYLAKKQPRKARQAGLEFIRLRRSEAKGYVLVGDAYFQEQAYDQALRYYQEAEQRKAADKDLLLKLGRTFRLLGQPRDAIERLTAAAERDRDDVDIAVELGTSFLHDKIREDANALTAVDRLLEKNPDNADLRYIAARALYNQGKLAQAKVLFMDAYKLRGQETKYRDGLIDTINRQAAAIHDKGNAAQAKKLLLEAYGYDKAGLVTNQNLAVLSLEAGECDQAQDYLEAMRGSPKNTLIAHRLSARAYLCQKKPDLDKALEHYREAEKDATTARNNLIRAEIYAELAPLLMASDLDDAIDRLEQAVQFAGREAGIADAAKRNLAIASFRRGWRHLRTGKGATEAVADFERATREPRLLQGTELAAFEFSLALAHLERGDADQAAAIFAKLGQKGGQEKYLKAPYDKLGNQFFSAYAGYRSSNVKVRQKAAEDFAKLLATAKGPFAAKLKELLASSWEHVAHGEFAAGNTAAASKALDKALGHVTAREAKRRIDHNRIVLSMSKSAKTAEDALSEMGATPPEALMNLGIVHDRAGRPRAAYDAWVAARTKGVKLPRLDSWIAAKQRIFGY
jgi:tetratricopeptide (TPR) repeat protein